MNKKGFLDHFLDSYTNWSITQFSKKMSDNGKPDPYVAAGIAAGLGRFNTIEDKLSLGVTLAMEGAFDETENEIDDDLFEEYEELVPIEDYDWRKYCANGEKYDISPYDYDNENAYEKDLYLAKIQAKSER